MSLALHSRLRPRGHPLALELRRMQMIAEVGAEKNSTTIMLMPSDFVTLANGLTRFLDRSAK